MNSFDNAAAHLVRPQLSQMESRILLDRESYNIIKNTLLFQVTTLSWKNLSLWTAHVITLPALWSRIHHSYKNQSVPDYEGTAENAPFAILRCPLKAASGISVSEFEKQTLSTYWSTSQWVKEMWEVYEELQLELCKLVLCIQICLPKRNQKIRSCLVPSYPFKGDLEEFFIYKGERSSLK